MVGRRLPHPDAERRLFEWVQRRITRSGYFSDEVQVTLVNAVKQCGLELSLSPGCAGWGVSPAGSASDTPAARTSGALLLVAVRLPQGTMIDGRLVENSFVIGEVALAELGCELIGQTIMFTGGPNDDVPS